MADRKTDALARLRAVDEALARRGPSAAASERVRRALAEHAAARPFHARLRWWPMLGFIAGAALTATLLLDGRAPAPVVARTPGASAPAETTSEVTVPNATAPAVPDVTTRDTLAAAPADPPCPALVAGRLAVGNCAQADGVRVRAWTPATLARAGDRVEVVDGEVEFDVEPRPERPLHVIAGRVDIEVVGTRFVVHQRDGAGWVSLLEGHLRVRTGDGEVHELTRGGRLEWPPSRAKTSPSRPKREGKTPPTAPADAGLAELLDEVAALRRAGAFSQAVARLRAADDRGWSERSRQLVSYEIGALLERQLGESAAACAHWREHRRRFPGGRHDAMVARSLERLHCASE